MHFKHKWNTAQGGGKTTTKKWILLNNYRAVLHVLVKLKESRSPCCFALSITALCNMQQLIKVLSCVIHMFCFEMCHAASTEIKVINAAENWKNFKKFFFFFLKLGVGQNHFACFSHCQKFCLCNTVGPWMKDYWLMRDHHAFKGMSPVSYTHLTLPTSSYV